MRGVKFDTIRNAVETNNKQRYTLLLEPVASESAKAGDDTTPIPVELPHSAITIPPLPGTQLPLDLEDLVEADGTWYIRANQGHTLKVSMFILLVHGTDLGYRLRTWNCIM